MTRSPRSGMRNVISLFPNNNSSVFLGNMSAGRSLKTSSTRLANPMSSGEISRGQDLYCQELSPEHPPNENTIRHYCPHKG